MNSNASRAVESAAVLTPQLIASSPHLQWIRRYPAAVETVSSRLAAKNRPQITAIIPTLALHPSCTVSIQAADSLRARGHRPVDQSFICYKHGGHFPGCWRGGIPKLLSPASAASVQNEALMQHEHSVTSAAALKHLQQLQRSAVKKPGKDSAVTQLLFKNAVVLDGAIYSAAVSAKEGVRHFEVSGIYSMISGNWPQTLTRKIPVFPLAKLPEDAKSQLRKREQLQRLSWEFGYWQPPTDFLSSYHVTVEVTLTMFHAVLRAAAATRRITGKASSNSLSLVELWNDVIVPALTSSNSSPTLLPASNSAAVVTSRPQKAMWGFKKKSCRHGGEICLSTVWATMYTTLFSFVAPALSFSRESSSSRSPPSSATQPAEAMRSSSVERSTSAILGLADGDEKMPRFFRNLLVGYPTHCEPLWGKDPIILNLTRDSDSAQLHFSADTRRALEECDLLLWAFNNVLVRSAVEALLQSSSPLSSASNSTTTTTTTAGALSSFFVGDEKFDEPIATAPEHIPKVLFASRRGDWARQVKNELQFLVQLDEFIENTYALERGGGGGGDNNTDRWKRCKSMRQEAMQESAGSGEDGATPGQKNSSSRSDNATGVLLSLCFVKAARFGGPLENQIRLVAKREATIFMAPHGANILPSVFLPPNAGVITLDSDPGGFYPFGTVPSWLHWRRVTVTRVCNRRLQANRRGKCKVSSFNNDDLKISSAQREQIFGLVRDIVASQRRNTTLRTSRFKSLFSNNNSGSV